MDITEQLRAQVRAATNAAPLNIVGGGSKAFYGRTAVGAPLHLAGHSGVVNYDPAELVVTARAGTRLAELEDLLAERRQMLGFEPPRFGKDATIGGAVAAGLAGPRRPFSGGGGGGVRDFLLGVKIMDGRGEVMHFGGEVMKNVAGFDVSRLMAGAMGTLGVLLEVSLRLVPKPQQERTLLLQHKTAAESVAFCNRLAGKPLPVSGAIWHDGVTRIRLSGGGAGLRQATAEIGGEVDYLAPRFWRKVRDHDLPFFHDDGRLLRVSLPATAEFEAPDGAMQFADWGGAQRWLIGGRRDDVQKLREATARVGGHVTLFRAAVHADAARAGRDAVFTPLPPAVQSIHLRLKRAFDPNGVLNRGRMYENF